VTVAAVISAHVILITKGHGRSNYLRLLANAGMYSARDVPALHHLGSALVKVSNPKHSALHLKQQVLLDCRHLISPPC
jgi:hypothetical protein